METFALTVEKRDIAGHKVRHLRTQGIVPAVVYGAGEPAQMIQIDGKSLETLLARGGATHVIDLDGAGIPKGRVLIREVQRHPLRRFVTHMDFVRIAAGAKIRMEVPLLLVGTAPVVADGAIVLQNADTVEVECLPDDLPEHIAVDISGLTDVHGRIALSDLKLPAGVLLVGEHLDEAVITVSVPRSVLHAEDEEGTAASAEPEVIKKGKEEE